MATERKRLRWKGENCTSYTGPECLSYEKEMGEVKSVDGGGFDSYTSCGVT